MIQPQSVFSIAAVMYGVRASRNGNRRYADTCRPFAAVFPSLLHFGQSDPDGNT